MSGSAINLAPMANSDDDDLQFAVVDFVDDPVITHAHAPGGTTFKFLHAGWTRIVFQFAQTVENAAGNVTASRSSCFCTDFGRMT